MQDKTSLAVPEAFAALGVQPSILRALAELKYSTPTEIQAMLIPRALAGVDLLGQARTGTGKTAAFAIPLLQKCAKGVATQAIILVPTRELAVQVEAEVQRLGQYTPIRSVPVFGGQKIAAQIKFLKHHPEILVGTPGRVIDLLDRRIIDFKNVAFVVLDEVDRMLDIGFREDIRNILSRLPRRGVDGRRETGDGSEREVGSRESGVGSEDGGRQTVGGSEDEPSEASASSSTPDSRLPTPDYSHPQTIFVSATISDEIERLGRRYMHEPIEKLVVPGSDQRPTVESVEQYYLSVQPWDKYRLLFLLLERETPDLAIVFCRTKRGAEKLAKKLHADGIECREIHGNLAQNRREKVMKSFRTGKFDVLIATDLASRGIDVADISHIINYDIPEDPEIYVHRVGRTARMGAAGKAFTFVGAEQGDELTRVEALINMVIPQAKLEGFEARPTPSDWTEGPPTFAGSGTPAAAPISRFQRPYGATATGTESAPVVLPPRTIGSKIPLTRRHKRRR